MKEVVDFWDSDRPSKAGETIYDHLPLKSRPRWAAGILEVILRKSSIHRKLFERVLNVAKCEDEWCGGHRLFDALRKETLKMDDLRLIRELSEEEELSLRILELSESVAKVIYNATNPPDEFDEDCGHWIAPRAKWFFDNRWRDDGFATELWSALFL